MAKMAHTNVQPKTGKNLAEISKPSLDVVPAVKIDVKLLSPLQWNKTVP